MTTTALQTAARYITREFIPTLQQGLVGRKLIAQNPEVSGKGISSVELRKIVEMGRGNIQYKLPQRGQNKDNVRIDASVVDVPVLFKTFEIPRQDYDAWTNEGKRIDTTAAQSAAYQVGLDEDEMIINGWKPDGSNYEVTGLYNLAGNDYTTTSDFATNGKALSAVSGAMALIAADSALAPAYNLTLNSVQWGQLLQSYNANGIAEMPQVIQLLNRGNPNGGPGEILVTDAMAAATGLLSPVDPTRRFMEFYNPVPIRTQLGIDPVFAETADVEGMVYETLYPYVKHAVGLCKLSSI